MSTAPSHVAGSARSHPFLGWHLAQVPVVRGTPPPGTVPLAVLADAGGHGPVLSWVEPLAGPGRAAAMTVLHYALAALAEALVAPLAIDGAVLEIDPTQIGIVLGRAGELRGVWVGAWRRTDPARPALAVGGQLRRHIEPLAARTRSSAALGARGVANVIGEALERRCERLRQATSVPRRDGWIDELVGAAGGRHPAVPRTVAACPDRGPLVELKAPTTCCVLAPAAGPAACPTCPRHPPAEQRAIAEAWLADLSASDFREVAGRPRVL